MLEGVTRVFVRSESLRRAVVDLGCKPNKIEIVGPEFRSSNSHFANVNFRKMENGDYFRPGA